MAGETRLKLPPAVKYILGNEACERFSFYGMSTILVPYMQKVLDWERDRAAGVFHDFIFAAYAMTVVGAWLSDRFFGRYRTILWLSYGYVAGHATLAAMDVAPGARAALLFSGMALIVIGQAGIKPNLSAFVGDQFRQDQAGMLDRVYSLFYVAINIGSATSQFITPWLLAGCAFGAIKLCERSAVAWAFGVPGILMFLALIIYLVGSRLYVKVPPAGRDPNGFLRVLWTRIRRGESAARAKHGDAEVDGMRSVFRIALVFAPTITFWALYFQYGSSWFNQAEQMDRNIFGWHMESAQMEALNAILILIMVPLFAYVLYPAVEKAGLKATLLRRMTAGMFVTVPSFLAAAMIQHWIEQGQHPHIAWQTIQYVIVAIGETLVSVTALEFAYSQAPRRMKGVIMSMYTLSIGLGSFITSLVTQHVEFASRTNYFLFWAAFMAFGAILFAIIAALYKPVAFVAANQEAQAA
ncbi:MAG TPA: MFS transporter [Myxococcales bacterium]|nr:MFS transporter [Myxococcales bacterium]